jgi:hypothetical protein
MLLTQVRHLNPGEKCHLNPRTFEPSAEYRRARRSTCLPSVVPKSRLLLAVDIGQGYLQARAGVVKARPDFASTPASEAKDGTIGGSLLVELEDNTGVDDDLFEPGGEAHQAYAW